MKIVSIQVGRPRLVEWNGDVVSTGIFKEPVTGPVMLRELNLDGDRQADLSVHGGVTKAVYSYPAEHYDFWRKELPEMDLPYGMFGENFTVEGVRENELAIGSRFRIGEAEVMVTEPRMPCYKLGIKFGRSDIIKRFLQSRRTGFYFSVLREGLVVAGDTIEKLSAGSDVTIDDITRLYAFEKDNLMLLQRAVKVGELPAGWRDYFQKHVDKLQP